MNMITIINEYTGEVVQKEFPTPDITEDFFQLCWLALSGEFGESPEPYYKDEEEEEEYDIFTPTEEDSNEM